MSEPITLQRIFYFTRGRRSAKKLCAGEPPAAEPGERVPRVSRLMALAIRMERLVHEGAVTDFAELARLGHVTRSRLTQIVGLGHLAPDIQEQILFLPASAGGRDAITERHLRPMAAVWDWRKQRRMWRALCWQQLAGGSP